MDDFPGAESFDLYDIAIVELAAARRLDFAVALDAALCNQGLRLAAGCEHASPLEELVELDLFGVDLDFLDVHMYLHYAILLRSAQESKSMVRADRRHDVDKAVVVFFLDGSRGE